MKPVEAFVRYEYMYGSVPLSVRFVNFIAWSTGIDCCIGVIDIVGGEFTLSVTVGLFATFAAGLLLRDSIGKCLLPRRQY